MKKLDLHSPAYLPAFIIVTDLQKNVIETKYLFNRLGINDKDFSFLHFESRIHPRDTFRFLTYIDEYIGMIEKNSSLISAQCQIDYNLRAADNTWIQAICFITVDKSENDINMKILFYNITLGVCRKSYIPRQVQVSKDDKGLELVEIELRQKVARTLESDLPFTPTEFSILHYLSKGCLKEEVMKILDINKGSTYDTHIKNINQKLKETRGEIMRFYPALDSAQKMAFYLRAEGYFGKGV